MTYRIKLTTQSPEVTKFKFRDVFRIRIIASDSEDMPSEIFLYQKTLVNPQTGEDTDEFIAICSPFDLSIYPANEPNPTQDPPFFRKDTIDVLLPSVETVDTFVTSVQEQVCHLISLLKKLDDISTTSVIWCPEAPDESSSSSNSE